MILGVSCHVPVSPHTDPHHGEETGSVTQVEELRAEDIWLHPPLQGW